MCFFKVLPILPLLGVIVCAIVKINANFTYQRGHCDVYLPGVVKDVLTNKISSLRIPSLRISRIKPLKYELYTPLNPYKPQMLQLDNADALKCSSFNSEWPVRFAIHGWLGKSTTCSNAAIKDAYLARGKFNVIIVDWSTHSMKISYSRVTKQFDTVAFNIASFLQFLHRQTGVPYESMYLIGHSAGCHISGLVGKLLKPAQLGAIIALDPATYTRSAWSANQRLAPSDAKYVESVHTDISFLGNPSTQLSQAAFFINNGYAQPQCPNATTVETHLVCDHFSAVYYFAESVRNPHLFGAIRCNHRSLSKSTPSNITDLRTMMEQTFKNFTCTCAENAAVCDAEEYMGGEPIVPKSGVFYVGTQRLPPFGMGARVNVNRSRVKLSKPILYLFKPAFTFYRN